MNIPPSSSSRRVMITDEGVFMHHVAWLPPPDKSWKLNFAGFVSQSTPRLGGASFIIRDEDGVFKNGFATPVTKVKHALLPELVALSSGLDKAMDLGIEYLEVEGDCSVLFPLIQLGLPKASSRIRNLLDECKNLLRAFRSVTLSDVNADTNAAASRLAFLVMKESKPLFWPNWPPAVIMGILVDDVRGRWVQVTGP